MASETSVGRGREKGAYLDQPSEVHQEALGVIDVFENLHCADNVESALSLRLKQVLRSLMTVL